MAGIFPFDGYVLNSRRMCNMDHCVGLLLILEKKKRRGVDSPSDHSCYFTWKWKHREGENPLKILKNLIPL